MMIDRAVVNRRCGGSSGVVGRPDTLDPALLRPGRMDRRVEFGLPDLEGRAHIFTIHCRSMNCERDIRYELLARLCPNSTGADIRSVCTEAGMFAIRARRKVQSIPNSACAMFSIGCWASQFVDADGDGERYVGVYQQGDQGVR